MITLNVALGIRKATATIIRFPAFIFSPAFTFWTFGPVPSTSCCIYRKKEPKIHLSYRFTWINAFLTSCITGGFLAYRFSELWDPYHSQYFYSALALLSLSLITLVLIQFLGKCSRLCSESCLPMKPKTIYNTETEEKC